MTDSAWGPCLSSALRGGTRAGDLRRSFRAVLASTFTNRPNARSLVRPRRLALRSSCFQDTRVAIYPLAWGFRSPPGRELHDPKRSLVGRAGVEPASSADEAAALG